LQRAEVKRMLRDWERQYPGRTETIFKSIRNVAPSQLADRELFDFETLSVERAAMSEVVLPIIKTVSL
jgi:tRNA 2-thiocytidine biosynthesis protein TtcA